MNDVIVAHLLSVTRGIAAGLATFTLFHIAGVLLLPRRWERSADSYGPTLMGAACYVVLCWIAISSRNIPIIFVVYVLAASLCLLASTRLAWLQSALKARFSDPSVRLSMLAFCGLYLLMHVLILPPMGSAYLPLAPAGNVDLVTYARYAQRLLEQGTPGLELAAFDYLDSPASTYLLAWQSMFFGRDPLTAAMPTLFALAALFGVLFMGVARSIFTLPASASLAIACVALTSPFFRWAVSGYALSGVLGGTIVLYMTWLICRAAISRAVDGAMAASFAAACVLLSFVEPLSLAWVGRVARATFALVTSLPWAIIGLPSRMLRLEKSGAARSDAVVTLLIVPLVLACVAHGLQRAIASSRTRLSETDRQLAITLVGCVMVAFVIGNVAVDAVRDRGAERISGAWRNLAAVNRLSFRAMTLKLDDTSEGLRTALALYFLPVKKAKMLGPEVDVEAMPLDAISKNEPIFIHNFGCQGAGHNNTVPVPGIGCLILSPPSIQVGKSYAFNQTFLFLTYENMARTSGGRLSTRRMAALKITADPEIVVAGRDLYVNLFVNPVLLSGAKPQQLLFEWGSHRRGEALVGAQVWLSFPVRSDDWIGNRLWTLAVSIAFPDGRPILFHELSLTEMPRGRLLEPSSKVGP